MTKDEIIEMARQAGAMFDHMTWVERDLLPVFERFAKLVAEKALETKEGILDRNSYLLGLYDQKPWVGLKDDDEIPWDGVDAKSFARAIEAKLKEKNT